MFTKLEQRSWLKLKQTGAKQQKSYRGLEEACGTAALPYRTAARWVQAFRCRLLRPDHQKTGAAKGIMRLPHRWELVLHNFGEYIEGLWKYVLCRCAVSKVTAALPKLKFQPSYDGTVISWLIFRRYLVQIPSGILTILYEVFLWFFRSPWSRDQGNTSN